MDENKNQNKKRMNPVLKRVLVVILGLAVIAGFILFDKDVQMIDEVLRQMIPIWLIGGVICVFIYYWGETHMYMVACRAIGLKEKWYEGLITSMLGLFYSALTPLASGGQPFQIVQMKGRGISVGASTCVLMVKFLAWHVSLSLFALVSVIFKGKVLLEHSTTVFVLFIIGLLIHFFAASMGILLTIKPALVHRMGTSVIRFGGKLFNKKKPERTEHWQEKFDEFIDDYKQATGFALEHKLKMARIILTAMIEIVAYMATTYFVYRGLGFSTVGFWEMTCLQAMLSVSVAFIPLPGASIASEGGFYAIFTKYFGGSRLVGMLIWRALTYYMTILIGLVIVIIDGLRVKNKDRRILRSEKEY